MTGGGSPLACHLRPIFNLGCLFPPIFACRKMDPLRGILRIQPDSGHVILPHINWTPTSKRIVWFSNMLYTWYNLSFYLYFSAALSGRKLGVCFQVLSWHEHAHIYIYTHTESPPCTSRPCSHLTWAANWTNSNRHSWWASSRGLAACARVRSR